MKNVSSSSTVVVTKEQVWCDLAGEIAILNLKNGVYYGLDPVSARIWELMQQPTTVESICMTLGREYDVESQRCHDDVVKLLDELAANELIEIQDNDPIS